METNADKPLVGWKQIADYLKCSIRQAQYFEKDHGLPITRIGNGKKATPYLLRESAADWIREQNQPRP